MKLTMTTFGALKDGDKFTMDNTIFGKIYVKNGEFATIGGIGVRVKVNYPVYIRRIVSNLAPHGGLRGEVKSLN